MRRNRKNLCKYLPYQGKGSADAGRWWAKDQSSGDGKVSERALSPQALRVGVWRLQLEPLGSIPGA